MKIVPLLFFFSLLFMGGLGLLAAEERELFMEAERRLRAEDWPAALELYGDFLEEYPFSRYRGDAVFRRGTALFALERFAEADRLFAQVERRYPSSRFYGVTGYWRGRCALEEGDWERAWEELNRFRRGVLPLLEDAEDSSASGDLGDSGGSGAGAASADSSRDSLAAQALLLQGRAGLKMERYSDLAEEIRRSVAVYPSLAEQEPELLLMAAQAMARAEEWGRLRSLMAEEGPEERFLEAAADLSGKDQRLLRFYEARAREEEDETDEAALDLYEELARGGDDLALYSLVKIIQGGRGEDPSELLRRWSEDGVPSEGQGRELWERGVAAAAQRLYQQGNSREAAALLEEWVPKSPLLARIYLEKGRWAEGLAMVEPEPLSYLGLYRDYREGELDRVLEALSGRGEGRSAEENRLYGAALMRRGRYGEAAEVLQGLADGSAQGKLDWAKALFGAGKYSRVLDVLPSSDAGQAEGDSAGKSAGKEEERRAVRLYLEALSRVGTGDYKGGKKALADWRAAGFSGETARVMEPYIRYYQAYVLTMIQPSDLEGAVEEWKALAEDYSGHPLEGKALQRAGLYRYRMGEYARAEALLSEALKAVEGAVGRADVLHLLGLTFQVTGRTGKAVDSLNRAVQELSQAGMAEKRTDYLWELYRLYREDSRWEEAVGTLDRIAPDPGEDSSAEDSSAEVQEILYQKALTREAQGREEEAYELLQEYRRRFSGGERIDQVLYRLGVVRQRRGQAAGAVIPWERLIKDYPDSSRRPETLYRTATVYAGREDYEQARRWMAEMKEDYPREFERRQGERLLDRWEAEAGGGAAGEASLRRRWESGGAGSAASREAGLELAEGLLYRGEAEEAREILEAVQAQGDEAPVDGARAELLLGADAYNRGRLVEAGKAFLRAADLGREEADVRGQALYRALEVLLLAERPDMAERALDQLEAEMPDSYWAEEARRLWEDR